MLPEAGKPRIDDNKERGSASVSSGISSGSLSLSLKPVIRTVNKVGLLYRSIHGMTTEVYPKGPVGQALIASLQLTLPGLSTMVDPIKD